MQRIEHNYLRLIPFVRQRSDKHYQRLSKISDHQKARGSITTKACELYQTLWSAGAYTASDKALRVSLGLATRD